MISFGANTCVYLAAGATDMRKAVNGLMILVEDVLEADPFSSHLFVFCNRLRDTHQQNGQKGLQFQFE